MFGKKKEEIQRDPTMDDKAYIDWKEDLGFLTFIMARKKNIVKGFFIDIFDGQLPEDEFIKDGDIIEIIESSTEDILGTISPRYRRFLTDKYFGNDQQLIDYITEDLYIELVNASINKNKEKVIKTIVKERVRNIARRNSDD